MKLLLHPGGALFVMAAIAFVLRRFVPIDRVPLIGGAMMTVALFAMIFGVIGGVFLTIMMRKGEASA
jgi:hypothetical protein